MSTIPVPFPGVISDVFGRLFVASQLEDAVIEHLKYWFPTYLSEVARQEGISRNDLPQPQNYTNRNKFDTEAGEKVPKIVVLTPGTIGTPTKDGYGTYTATWRLGVGVATSGKDEESANMKVKSYAAAIRGIITQKPGLDGIIDGIMGISFISENYNDIPITNQHQLFKGANVWFAVEMYNIVTNRGGPDSPTVDPSEYPTVETVGIDIEMEVKPVNANGFQDPD